MELALSYLVYFFAAFGLAFVVGFSKISQPFRNRLFLSKSLWIQWFCALLECPGCFGFWVGLFVGAIEFVPDLYPTPRLVFAVTLGFATAGLNMVLAAACGFLDERKI